MGLRQYPLSREDTLVWACLDYATDLEQRIPFDWYKIFREKGRPYLVAITILADLRFWYTPYVSRGTDGGTAYSKKFRGELLQRDYFQLERDYGITQDQAKRAMRWLESMGVARRVTEAVVGEGGMKGGTRMYMVYYADKVRELELEWRAEAAAPRRSRRRHGSWRAPPGRRACGTPRACPPAGNRSARRGSG